MKKFISIKKKIKKFNKIINVDGDKSISIRSLIFASLATGKSKIKNLLESEDVLNTVNCLKVLGVKINKKKNHYLVKGVGINKFKYKKKITLNAGNSGTLARLLLSTLINSPFKIKLVGDQSLTKRDFGRIIEPLSNLGAQFYSQNKNKLPLVIKKSTDVKK